MTQYILVKTHTYTKVTHIKYRGMGTYGWQGGKEMDNYKE